MENNTDLIVCFTKNEMEFLKQIAEEKALSIHDLILLSVLALGAS